VSGPSIRLYTDEDVHAHVAEQLQRLGYDVLSCVAAGNAHQQISDDWQLRFATRNRRAILTHNIADYVVLDAEWRASGHEHWGIVLVSQETPLHELIQRTRQHLATIAPDVQYNAVLFLAR